MSETQRSFKEGPSVSLALDRMNTRHRIHGHRFTSVIRSKSVLSLVTAVV